MKILINQQKYVEKFVCLTNALQEINGIETRFINGILDDQFLAYFKPDIIIHNMDDGSSLDKRNMINIKCDFGAQGNLKIDLNLIGPCIDIHLFKKIEVKDKYKCDIVFFGDISVFDNELLEYANTNHSLRVFNHIPVNIPFYCGSIPRNEHPSAYKSAWISPFSIKEDKSRLYEIIKSGGRPVVYNPEKKGFHTLMKHMLTCKNTGESFEPAVYVTENEITEAMNVYKLSESLKGLGFEKLSQAVIKRSL